MINSLKKQVNNNLNNFYNALSYKGKWTLSDGVVDCYGNKFPIPIDTKVISKLFESQFIFLDNIFLTFVILGPKSLNWSKNLTGWFSNFFCHD